MVCIPYILRALKRKDMQDVMSRCEARRTLHVQIARWPKGPPVYGVDSDFTWVLPPVKCRNSCTLAILARSCKTGLSWHMIVPLVSILGWGGRCIFCDVPRHLGVPKILPLLGCFEWRSVWTNAGGWVMNSRYIMGILATPPKATPPQE